MNDNLQREKEFFHSIAQKVRKLVSSRSNRIEIARHKKEGDFATHVDVGVENLIVKEIKKRFPKDQILAEENFNNTTILKDRIWIIDPICGTNNLARGIKNFCTNIALGENNKLIAACVIDHSYNDYFWSIGDKKVYINTNLLPPAEKRYDVIIDVDFGAVIMLNKTQKDKHNRFLKKVIAETNFSLISLNSSISFAYTAIGKIDGFLNMASNPWDICAASFLIQTSGGIISDINGQPWTIKSKGAIAARNKEFHEKLYSLFKSA